MGPAPITNLAVNLHRRLRGVHQPVDDRDDIAEFAGALLAFGSKEKARRTEELQLISKEETTGLSESPHNALYAIRKRNHHTALVGGAV